VKSLRVPFMGSGSRLRSWCTNSTSRSSYVQIKITCIPQVTFDKVSPVPGKLPSKRRSPCPVSVSLERFGDRWSLLIIRDLMVRGFRTFKQFQEAGEGIATNVLADRLRRLQAWGIITAEDEASDRRRVNYRLTEKGIDLAPVMLELLVWGARHEETGAPCALVESMARNRDQVLAETRRRWQERDSTPLLPKFSYPRAWRRTRRAS
jgi:DNA-binding HxlR family transcriptional regulator